MAATPTHYDRLGVSRTAPPEIIKAAYRTLSKLHHPDTGNEASEVDFKAITNAYTVLSNATTREKYDQTLSDAPTDSSATPDAETDTVDPDAYQDTWGTEDTWTPEYEYTPTDFAQEDPRKLAGFDAWATMPFTPEQAPWLPEARARRRDYVPLNGPPQAQARPAQYGLKTGIAAAVWVVAAIAYSVAATTANTGIFGFGAFIGAAVFGLPYALGAKGGFPKYLTIGYYAFAGLALLLGLMMSATGSFQPGQEQINWGTVALWLAVTTAALCASFGFAAYYMHHWRTGPPAPRRTTPDGHLIDPTATETYWQWGTPGRGLHGGNAPFSERNATLGFGGEVLTSQLIDPFAEIPGVRIVHGINLPGHGQADFDHVILCGNLLVVADSKNWTGGSYYWLSEQITATTNDGLQTRGNPMSWGLGTFHQMFPNKQILPVVVIHSHDGASVATNNRNRGANPVLMTPREFVEQIGQMCVDQHATTVDRETLTRLVQLMAR